MVKKSKSEERMESMQYHVFVCRGGSCTRGNSEDIFSTICQSVKDEGLDNTIRVTESGCMLRCSQSPTVVVYPEGVWYQKMTPEAAGQVVKEHLKGGTVVAEKAQYRYIDGKFEKFKAAKNRKKK